MSMISNQIDRLREYAKDKKGELARLINDAARTIEMLSAKQSGAEWILCSERLPDKDGNYIVTENSGGTTSTGISFFIICDDGRTWWELFGVVAWMPLPEPYKEEGNG